MIVIASAIVLVLGFLFWRYNVDRFIRRWIRYGSLKAAIRVQRELNKTYREIRKGEF